MSDNQFIREIDEELRRDRLAKLWERHSGSDRQWSASDRCRDRWMARLGMASGSGVA